MAQDPVARQIESDITKGLDDAVEALRWARRHLHDRKAGDTLRLVQLNLNAIALALDWQMEGEADKALAAVDRLWWKPHREEAGPADMTPTGH
jgi:hypothetical protein